jgi:superfamily II DNA or RNA helicase
MWWNTLRSYFGVEPCVLHGTNPNYDSRTAWNKVPEEKFILISYRLFNSHLDLNWFDPAKDLLIIDEAHHHVSIPPDRFKEVIGLSATTNKSKGLSRGISNLLESFNVKIDDCIYNLSKSIIAKALSPVEYYPYVSSLSEDVSISAKECIEHTKTGAWDISCLSRISNIISHPESIDLNKLFTAGTIRIGRKNIRIHRGDRLQYNKCLVEIEAMYPNLPRNQITQKMESCATFDIKKLGVTYPKYVQAYHIIKKANDQGDKVLLFDNSIEYLPFLYQFLTAYGINTYLFSTHYDVSGRQKQLTKFKEDTAPGVLLSSIGMLGEGHNVTEANHVIFFAQNLDGTKYYQAIGRCWRYPQEKTVKIHLLFAGDFDRAIYEHACGGTDIRTLDWKKIL